MKWPRIEERSLQAQVNRLTGDVLDLRDRSIQYNILQRELDTTRTLYEGLLQRYKEVGVTGGVAANNISIIDLATPPNAPSKPNLLLNMVFAALLGLGLGVLAALILEALDETLATPDDVEKKLGIPVLGVAPLLDKGETPANALSDIRSAFSEAYYSLRTALQFSTPDGAPSSLLVSSARPAEGKSTTAYAVALNLARVGKRVLLIDGDLRNPSMHRVVGVENERGMSNLLSGSADLASVIQQTRQENLFFIPCGPLPPNPAELWGGDRLAQFLGETTQQFRPRHLRRTACAGLRRRSHAGGRGQWDSLRAGISRHPPRSGSRSPSPTPGWPSSPDWRRHDEVQRQVDLIWRV